MTNSVQSNVPKNYFVAQKLLLQCFGLSLSTKPGMLYKTYRAFLVVLMVTYSFFTFSELFRGQMKFDDFVDNVLYGTGVFVAMAKQIIILTKRSKLRKVMDSFENDPYLYNFEYREPTETMWIKKCIDFTRKLNIAGAVLGIYAVTSDSLIILFIKKADEELLPYGTITFLLERVGYVTVYAYECLAMYSSIIYTVVDIIFANIILHICIQFRILQNFIKRMDKLSYMLMIQNKNLEQFSSNIEADVLEPSILEWKYLQKVLKETIRYHLAVLDISKRTEDIFNTTVLIECTGVSVICCLVLYRASMYPVTDFHFQKYMAILLCTLGSLFVMSYLGNEVIVESQAIAGACSEVNFVGIDVRFQKCLVLIMQRSQRPIAFTVGKFATLSLVTALTCLRGSYSYYMLVHNMHSK